MSPHSPTFDAAEFDADDLTGRKGSTRISVCLPARDEADTVGEIVSDVRRTLVDAAGLVDEILVIDDGSTDETAAVAAKAGARVVAAQELLPATGTRSGKGEALWKSVAASSGDVIVWLDADLVAFDPQFVTGLVGPLLADPELVLVKGFYERPFHDQPTGGGRVTELVARPVISLWFPELAGIEQPLGGEYAGRRQVLEAVPFAAGYGVDLALLIDVAARWGPERIAQVDLGVRLHRNRPLAELAPQAMAVLVTAARRAGIGVPAAVELIRSGDVMAHIDVDDRPPLVDVPSYRDRSLDES
jgi:glucosyl-3-phosphoglycerate synthase